MPQVFAQPEPFAAGFQGGIVEQYNKDRLFWLQKAKAQQEAQEAAQRQQLAEASFREQQHQFDTRLDERAHNFDALGDFKQQRLQFDANKFNAGAANRQTQEELHAELQGILQTQKLTQMEEQKLGRLQNALGRINEMTWSPQEKLDAARMVQKDMAPLLQRKQAAQQAAEKLQQVQIQKAQIQGQTAQQFSAQTAQQRLHTVRLPDGSTKSYVTDQSGTPHFVEPSESDPWKVPFPENGRQPRQEATGKSPLQQHFESSVVTDEKTGTRWHFDGTKFTPMPEPKAEKAVTPLAAEKAAIAYVKARAAGKVDKFGAPVKLSDEDFNTQVQAEKQRIMQEHQGQGGGKPDAQGQTVQKTQGQAAQPAPEEQALEQKRQQALQQAPPFSPRTPEYAQTATPEQKAFTQKAVALRQLVYKQDDMPIEKKREVIGWMDRAQELFEKYGSVEGMPPDARQDFKTFALLLEATKFNKSAAQVQKAEHETAASSAKAALDAAEKEYDAAQEAFNNYRGGDREQSPVRRRLDAARERAAAARAAHKQYEAPPARLGVFNIGVR